MRILSVSEHLPWLAIADLIQYAVVPLYMTNSRHTQDTDREKPLYGACIMYMYAGREVQGYDPQQQLRVHTHIYPYVHVRAV